MELIIIKQNIADDDMMHEWDEVPIEVMQSKTINASTQALAVYTAESMKPAKASVKNELDIKIRTSIDGVPGSNWSVKAYKKIWIKLHTNKSA